MATVSKPGVEYLFREISLPFAGDPDFVTLQDLTTFKTVAASVPNQPLKRKLAVYGGFFQGDIPVTVSRGSFDASPIKVFGTNLTDGVSVTGVIGWRRLLIEDIVQANYFGLRVTNIAVPGAADTLRLYIEGLV